jgi:hypothetical protein
MKMACVESIAAGHYFRADFQAAYLGALASPQLAALGCDDGT